MRIYALIALALSLASYNKNSLLSDPLRFLSGSSASGSAADRPCGSTSWPSFATLFGLATSLGFGAQQALAGLNSFLRSAQQPVTCQNFRLKRHRVAARPKVEWQVSLEKQHDFA
ncbi:MAG: BCCT family transporter [Brucellaceae bacterium]|nr:BCCT family transporter [Brucellaceae bacterium]